MREKTHAHRNFSDDVPLSVKSSRLTTLIHTFQTHQSNLAALEIGRFHLVLVDGEGKLENQKKGRTDTNKTVII
jgi:tRNA A37 methylthiotransferase MiaB